MKPRAWLVALAAGLSLAGLAFIAAPHCRCGDLYGRCRWRAVHWQPLVRLGRWLDMDRLRRRCPGTG